MSWFERFLHEYCKCCPYLWIDKYCLSQKSPKKSPKTSPKQKSERKSERVRKKVRKRVRKRVREKSPGKSPKEKSETKSEKESEKSPTFTFYFKKVIWLAHKSGYSATHSDKGLLPVIGKSKSKKSKVRKCRVFMTFTFYFEKSDLTFAFKVMKNWLDFWRLGHIFMTFPIFRTDMVIVNEAHTIAYL